MEKTTLYNGQYPDLLAHSAQKISKTAQNLAYEAGTAESVYTYPDGKAKQAFRDAINKVFPKRSSWSKQCQAGASCDVAAGTVIRASGADTAIPRGLQEQIPWLAKHTNNWKKTGIKSAADMQPGDVGVYAGNGAHIWIKVNNGYTAEASHTNKYFLHLAKRKYKSGKFPTWEVYRSVKPQVIRKGDQGSEVLKLQKWLNWYNNYNLVEDGDFGVATEKAVADFQKKNGLEPDAIFGEKTLETAKKIKK